ncbi:MAG: retroviral-like aspartic protease family protein [Steroidobacteraceae bacterium]
MQALGRILCLVALLPGAAIAAVAHELAPQHRPSLLSSAPTRLNLLGQIVVPVMIDGRGPFPFLLDTGANGSVIAPRLVKALGLIAREGRVERVEGVTGTQPLPWVSVRTLQVGRIVKHEVRMPICSTPIMKEVDGILGMAGFGPVRIAVDFRHHRVAIDRSSRGPMWGFLDIRAVRTRGGLLMIPARVGGLAVEAVIDTGSPVTLGNPALRKALLSHSRTGVATPIYGVTAQVSTGSRAVAPTLILGPVAIQHLLIVYSDVPIFREWHLQDKPAVIIGTDVLRVADSLVLDYPRARVYILPAPPPISMLAADGFQPGG